ncbi:MAG TPA: TonB-dependent receptor, partial [Thermoanaerobaculia bacterium]
YNGVLTNNFFVEAQYSAREYIIGQGSGSMSSDRIDGTLLIDQSRGARFWSPTFCAVCGPSESRDSDNVLGKATYFLTTSGGSSHEISAGFDRFDDLRQADNYQSGSNFRIWLDSAVIQNGEIYPVFVPYPNTDFYYQPIFETSLGNRFRTTSYYVNDRWRPNNRLQLNLGVRYDQNDGVDQAGTRTADDSAFSPRLGLTYDLFGNGGLLLNASYGRYVTAIANNIGDSASAAGNATTFAYRYTGPSINTDPNNLVPTAVALQQFFAWFDSVGGTNNTELIYGVGGGNSTAILESLKSPYADEFTVGATRRIGNRGIVRMDYVHREFGDFYVNRIDRTSGIATLPGNIVVDRTLVENDSSALERKYDAIQLQSQFRFLDRLTAGGNYTWSQAIGNFNGETAASGPVRTGVYSYPEYSEVSWAYPRGFLPSDQRHNAKGWLLYDVIQTPNHALNVSLLQNYQSGTPYGALGTLNIAGYVPDQGYRRPPTTASYYFTGRDKFRTDDVTRTDLALNYSLRLRLLGSPAEIFIQPEVLNVFGEEAVVNPNASVFTSTAGGRGLQRFNPWLGGSSTECPQGAAAAECTAMGANWQKGPNFGRATSPNDYQTPRTFRLSVGMRF